MTAKTREEIEGLEYDWLAVDADGHVAFFSTAGGGYAPDAFLRDTELADRAIASLLAQPAMTDASFAPELEAGLENTWRLMAERGLFAFDSDPHGGPYHMVSAPRSPARLSDLPSIASAVVVLNLRFADVAELAESTLAKATRP